MSEWVVAKGRHMIPTLDDFILQARTKQWPRNAYVNEPGWENLYLRYGRRAIDGEVRDPVIDIANLEAERKGEGTFKKLIERLKSDYPDCYIYVENVIVPQFRDGLRKMGFLETNGWAEASSFYLPPQKAS